MRCNLFALMLIAAALLLPRGAVADQNWKTQSAIWRQQDACTTEAEKAYPDYTPESNAKREKARKVCLMRSNLPVDGSSLSPQTPTAGTAQQ